MKRFLILGLLATLVVGCGGGGSNASTSSVTPTSNALAKYVGSYESACMFASGHGKDLTTITQNGNGSLSLITKTTYYDGAQCTGAVVGINTSATFTITFQATSVEVVTGISGAISLDKIAASAPTVTTTFTGPNVVGNCVTYQNGKTCLDSLVRVGGSANGGLYLEGSKVYTLVVGGVGYKVDSVMTKV